ncbi:TonB-dependent receptor [Rhodocytophaga rosea]|uniref:TonB-dependent receptor n=1 Tax=Rhodocytophaga rosea TaxID=2704465 RepID=A0A6C0GL16_9BACT|nr:TonB-dependent receptor [Rhodocytophaga rosea]QHT68669.1 TonB-dependent receptor [Rhodocytophaga rosea]
MSNNYPLSSSHANVCIRLPLPEAHPLGNKRPVGFSKSYYVCMLFLILLSVQTFAQTRTVSGKVTAQSDGTPLPGVNVLIKGTTSGTTTDVNGAYTLQVEPGTTLVFSFIGFTTQEIAVGTQSTLDVALPDDVQALSEVVVIGYGTQKKEDLTGSIAAISQESFNKGQVTTPEQLLVGKVAGVQITPGGAPGSGSRIRIRGGSSLNASNDPLVVIDGVPVDNTAISGSANPLSLINPNDIESFNILKDASATAIYGSRASNGVIIITTKKGRQGDKIRVDFSSLASIATNTKTVDVLSAEELRAVVNERGSASQKALLGSANTNWQKEIYRNAFSTDNNLSVSGSYKFLPYRLSVGYLNQDGVLKTSNFQRTSAAINLTPSFFNDHLKVSLNLKGSLTNKQFANEGAIGAAVAFDPTQPINAENNYGGFYEWTNANGSPNTLAPRNPVSLLEQNDDQSEVKRSIGNLQLDYKFHFFPDLRANLNLGYDISDSEGSRLQPATSASVFNQGGSRTQYAQSRNNKLLDFYLNYVKEVPALASKFDVTAGYSYQDFIRENPSFAGLNAAGEVIPGQEADPFPLKTQYTLIGLFGRLNYTFKDRYLLTATVRRDGSSRFGKGNKWGTFPSLAFAWKVNEESFLKNVQVLSELKLRAGYGVTGQQDISTTTIPNDYPYLPRYTFSDQTSQYQFGNQYYLTLRPEGYDANIKWEETTTINGGLDYGFMDGRITGSLDYYFKKTKDLLAIIPVPAGSNLTNRLLTNVGNIENRGLEAALNFTAINTEKLKWDVGVNATYNTSEITNLSKTQDNSSEGIPVGLIGGGVGNNIQIHTVGYRPYAFYVYQQVYDESGKPVEGLYVDRNNDGAVNNRDLYRYKNPEANVFFGLNSQVTYARFTAGFVLRGSVNNYVYNNVRSGNGVYRNITYPNYLTNLHSNVLETDFNNNQFFTDYYIENASFLRMETINFAYSFGRIFNDKADLRLSANIQNAFVITKYSGLDPEVAGGIDNNFYPRARIFSLGVNIGF